MTARRALVGAALASFALVACSSPKSLKRTTDATSASPGAWSDATLEMHARRVLHDLAEGTCARPVATWPAAYVRWNEGMPGDDHEIACWAKSALAHAGDAGATR